MKNRNKCGKNACRVTAFALCGVLLAGSVTPVYAADENTPKDENVYVNLNQDGSVDGIYVVNSYRLDADTQVVDYGNYESVKNLTSDAEIQQQKGTVTVDAQAGEFFYQGNLQSKEIPWEISISYTLDGKEVSAKELAGKNGKLGISIHVGQNDQVDSEFFDNYLLQVTLTMDMERCSNLEAPGATAANVGTDKQLVYSILAGSEKDITVTADVLDFEMDAISFQGLPMNLDVDRELFSLDDLHDKAGEVSNAADEFSDGAQDLEGGVNSLQEGVEGLQSGAESLKEGIDSYADGAKSLGDGIDTLQDGSNDLADGAQELVDGIVSLQDGANQLRDGYSGENGAASGARKLADGVKELKAGSHQLSEGVSTLIDMISGLGTNSAGSLDQKAQEALDGAEELNAALGMFHIKIDTGNEGDSYSTRMGILSDSLEGIIMNIISYLGSGMGSSAGNGEEEATEPVTDESITGSTDEETLLEEETSTEEESSTEETSTEEDTSTEGETSSEAEGEEGTDETGQSGTEDGNNTGDAGGDGSSSEGTESTESTESTGDTGSSEGTGSTESTESTGDAGSSEETESTESTGDASSSEETGSSSEGSSPAATGSNETDSTPEGGNSGSDTPSVESGSPDNVAEPKNELESPADGSTAAVMKTAVRMGAAVQTAALRSGKEAGRVISLSAGQGGDSPASMDFSFIIGKLIELKAGADQLLGAYEVTNTISASLGSEETQAQLAQLKEGATALDSGIGDLESATDALADGISQLADGTSQLADGVSELADGGSEFADGTKELADGVSDLADGVDVLNDASDALRDGSAQLADGTGELLDGTGDLADGVADLKEGTGEFRDQAGDIDTQIDEEVDGVINDLSGSDFEQISFVSDRNENVELVQFVMQTEGIQIPEETDIPVEEEPMSFWQRLLALFGF